jgi:hypothetical protein
MTHRTQTVSAGLSLFALIACSSSNSTGPSATGDAGGTSGAIHVNGTLGGQTLTLVDSIAIQTSTQTEFLITSYSGACGYAQAGNEKETSGFLKIKLDTNSPLAPGMYPLTDASSDAEYKTLDATCSSDIKNEATAGTITITASTDAQISGTFDLTFGADHLTGSFAAAVCAGVPSSSSGCTP